MKRRSGDYCVLLTSGSTTDISSLPSTYPKPLIVDTVLSFVAAFRLKGDTDSLKKIVVERFCNDDVDKAKKNLWGSCSSILLANDLLFHVRRDSDNRSQLDANLSDILSAFEFLDSIDSLPTICCEASMLHRIPPLSLDPVAEQVHSNTKAVTALSSVIEKLENKLSNFIDVGIPPPPVTNGNGGVSYATALSSTSKVAHPSSIAPRQYPTVR